VQPRIDKDALDINAMVALVKTAVPEKTALIDTLGVNSFHLIADDLERKLLAELRRDLDRQQRDSQQLEQAAALMAKANVLNARLPETVEVDEIVESILSE
jgi:hypothetical protein